MGGASPCPWNTELARTETFIHPTAIVDEGARIGAGTRVWHWVHISGGAVIGESCSFGQNVFVGNRVVIGDNVKIQNNVSVYDNVTLEDDVFCGPSMVFTNVHNPRSTVPRKDEFRNTLVKRGVTLGANCTIVCGVTIGEYAFIGAGAVVTRDVKPYALMAGVPARQIGWISRHGERLDLPLSGDGTSVCPATGETYSLQNGQLKLRETTMQVEAIYRDGRIEFVQPLHLKRDTLRVMVNVPDEEIEAPVNPYNLPAEVIERAQAMRERLDSARHAPLPPDEELPELTAKQLERMEAFELREDR
jgi:UDP-2-acetamido-3-amino-2,3-dideoxy-glucuronate N-acetyltransferase